MLFKRYTNKTCKVISLFIYLFIYFYPISKFKSSVDFPTYLQNMSLIPSFIRKLENRKIYYKLKHMDFLKIIYFDSGR